MQQDLNERRKSLNSRKNIPSSDIYVKALIISQHDSSEKITQHVLGLKVRQCFPYLNFLSNNDQKI